MDTISKALRRLTSKEQRLVKTILMALQKGKTTNLDIKKLKSKKTIFRVRKGSIRIIYQQQSGTITILAIERRSDTTYNNV